MNHQPEDLDMLITVPFLPDINGIELTQLPKLHFESDVQLTILILVYEVFHYCFEVVRT